MEEIIIKERQTRENMVDLINSSNLPAFILKSMLKDLYDQLINIEEEQYQEALSKTQKKEVEEDVIQ